MKIPSEADNLEFIPEEATPSAPQAKPAEAATPAVAVSSPPPAAAPAASAAPKTEPAEPEQEKPPSRARLFLQKLIHPASALHSAYLQAIDKSFSTLFWLRKRVGQPPEEEGGKHTERETDSRAHKKPVQEEAQADAAPVAKESTQPTKFRYLIGLLVIVAGVITGIVFSYVLLSTTITHQAKMIDDQMDEIARLEKQLTILQRSEARFRDEKREYQKAVEKLEQKHQAGNAP